MTSHARLVVSLDLRLKWEDVVETIFIPSSRKELTTDNATWFIGNGHKVNRNIDLNFLKALEYATEYLAIVEDKLL